MDREGILTPQDESGDVDESREMLARPHAGEGTGRVAKSPKDGGSKI